MSGFDWLVVIVMAVVGWLIVSYVLKRLKPSQSGDERPMPAPPERSTPQLPAPASPPGTGAQPGLHSLEEIGRSWHAILEVSSDASAAQIESAYHAKLADCDRMRFAADATPEATRLAEERRAQICQAYEFIRPLRA